MHPAPAQLLLTVIPDYLIPFAYHLAFTRRAPRQRILVYLSPALTRVLASVFLIYSVPALNNNPTVPHFINISPRFVQPPHTSPTHLIHAHLPPLTCSPRRLLSPASTCYKCPYTCPSVLPPVISPAIHLPFIFNTVRTAVLFTSTVQL